MQIPNYDDFGKCSESQSLKYGNSVTAKGMESYLLNGIMNADSDCHEQDIDIVSPAF